MNAVQRPHCFNNCIVPSVVVSTMSSPWKNCPFSTTVANNVVCQAIIDPLLGPLASTEQRNKKTILHVQHLADPRPVRTNQQFETKTNVGPHTDRSVMISVHCMWHTSGVARRLRQPSSVLTWHCQHYHTGRVCDRSSGLWIRSQLLHNVHDLY